jgi:Immunoglobulin I-set domain
MNAFHRPLAALAVLLWAVSATNNASGIDNSGIVLLERYTILDGSTLQYDNGNLLPNGKFSVLTTMTIGTFGVPISDYEPISGRPVMLESAFNEYKAAGVIPKWVRSRDAFPDIGIEPVVIVAVSGKGDPNPTIGINNQPQSQSVLQGGAAFFYVDASPLSYLSYQWKFKSKDIPGETSLFLEVPNVDRTKAGIYTVHLSTGGKGVTSAKALLRVVIPVTIKKDPKSQAVKTGKTAVFRVSASGTGPFSYQWYLNGAAIPLANKSFYAVGNVQQDQAGAYTVTVSNGLSDATSAEAVLTVSP